MITNTQIIKLMRNGDNAFLMMLYLKVKRHLKIQKCKGIC